MDEMPAGRQAIHTHILFPRERERAYSLIRSQVEKRHQAFIIYPLVEMNEDAEEDNQAAVEEHARLQKDVFPNLQPGSTAWTAETRRKRENDEVIPKW